ncbi:MAG: magnesium/cobalt transporter CorA [Ekhidna sp.]
MKQFDIRPDKIILSGLKSLTDFSLNLLEIKTEAKGKGEIAFIGEQKIDEVQTQLYIYDLEEVESKDNLQSFDFFNKLSDKKNHWLNFHGLHEVEIIEQLAKSISLDRITVRQTLDTTLRPKVEEYDHYLFFSIKSILKSENGQLDVEHLSFVLGKNYVISFQEKVGDHFNHIRNKIVEKLGLLRKKGSDFLLYQLLDAILDNYFETIDSINDEIHEIEKIVLTNPTQDSLVKLEQLKQMAELVKKSLNPFKEALRALQNRKTVFIDENNIKYFLDLTNSCLSAIEEIESTTKSLEGLTNIYFSSLSQKMNETMKVLTTVATIFIPLTFIAGVYGMNFENMPELGYKYGYFVTWGVMGMVFIGMAIYFKRKKWL